MICYLANNRCGAGDNSYEYNPIKQYSVKPADKINCSIILIIISSKKPGCSVYQYSKCDERKPKRKDGIQIFLNTAEAVEGQSFNIQFLFSILRALENCGAVVNSFELTQHIIPENQEFTAD